MARPEAGWRGRYQISAERQFGVVVVTAIILVLAAILVPVGKRAVLRENGAKGVIRCQNEGFITWHEFASIGLQFLRPEVIEQMRQADKQGL